MIRARLNDGTLILGIDAENVRRLRADQAINVALDDIGGNTGLTRIMIMYGNTLQDIQNELEKVLGPVPAECMVEVAPTPGKVQ